MNIGIDARMYGLANAGIGRYLENHLYQLGQLDQKNHYTIFAPQSKFKPIRTLFPNENFTFIPVSIKHYSIQEQILWPRILLQQALDLLHVPHYNLPLYYPRPSIITLHDLLWHHSHGIQLTTQSWPKYYLKYAGYRLVVKQALMRAQHIIVPSDYVKSDVQHLFPQIDAKKIVRIYEGIDHIESAQQSSTKLPIFSNPFVLYVGSLYPHKNVSELLQAIIQYNKQTDQKLHCYIVSARNHFTAQLKAKAVKQLGSQYLHFTGFISDADLIKAYQQALVLIQPSLSEGFGFTGLEAMRYGCPVIASPKTCLPEIYKQAALYLDSSCNAQSIIQAISKLITQPSLRERFIQKGYQTSSKYTWVKSTQQTLRLYEKML